MTHKFITSTVLNVFHAQLDLVPHLTDSNVLVDVVDLWIFLELMEHASHVVTVIFLILLEQDALREETNT